MFLSIHDVSSRTKLSVSSIYRLSRRNQFPHPIHLIGRRRVWAETAVNSWMQEKMAKAGERAL